MNGGVSVKIESIGQISTKTGDKGYSSDYSGARYRKEDLLFESLGTNDELSSQLGICYHATHYENIKQIQKHLERINSMIATDPGHSNYRRIRVLEETEIEWLENLAAEMLAKSGFERGFTLPGSETTPAGAQVDFARAIARRAERCFFRYLRATERKDLELCGKYLNRLSDFLFVMAKTI